MKKINWMVVALLLVAGCTTSRITSSWKAESPAPKKYNKIMVLGLIRDSDRALQENMENHLVSDLQALGYDARSSFHEYGPKAFDRMDEESAVARLRYSGVDAVVTIVLLDKQKESKYIPGNVRYSPYFYYQNRFWGYRTVLYNRIYEPGYYVTDTRYFWESNLYDMGTQALVYSAQTESFDPANTESMAHEYGRLIIEDLVKNNVMIKGSELPGKAF